MPYWKNTLKNTKSIDNFGIKTSHSNDGESNTEFYELEVGCVLDIVLDENHPIFKSGEQYHSKIDINNWPADLTNKQPKSSDLDLTWIGRALVRPLNSEKTTDKDQLPWAYPLDRNDSEFPLINETVILMSQNGKLYYTKKLNFHNWPNNNLDFSINQAVSGKPNNTLFTNTPLTGAVESNTNYKKTIGSHGFAGKYFTANNKIRTVRRFEGDMLLESRFGQTIHLTAYDTNRSNDSGAYPDYTNGGNPMILIRNRQRPLVEEGKKLVLYKKLPPINGTAQEKNVGGYLDENINHDGTSIHITSGQTISQYVTSCYKKMYGNGEEVSSFQGSTSFKMPTLSGDQIVINSDRLLFSSRYGETFHYSKKRYGIVTDNEYTVDAHEQIVLTTNTKTVINSPAIYLGQVDMANEPVLLGQTTVNWLYNLCEFLLSHTHYYHHSHVHAGKESPSTTQLIVQTPQLIALRDGLNSLLSRRVFVTGGGLAPGQNGGSITDGTAPLSINTGTGAGVPGGWKGANLRTS